LVEQRIPNPQALGSSPSARAITVAGILRIPAALLWGLLALLGAVVAAAAVLAPVAGDLTGQALGGPDGEGPAHLWGLWTAAANLPSGSPFLRESALGFPDRFVADLMDPLHLVVLGPLLALFGGDGVVLGWNLLPVISLALGGVGGWLLGARMGLSPPARAVLALGLAASPAVCGSLVPVGRTEQLAGAWVGLHLAFLLGFMQTGKWRLGLAAVVTLVAQSHAGWRPLMLLLGLEVPVALGLALRSPQRRLAMGRAVAVGGLAAVLTLPLLSAHLGVNPWWLDGTRPPSPFSALLPAVSLSQVVWGGALPEWTGEPPPQVGRVALVLAAVGAWLRPRQAGPWLLLGAVLAALALGQRVDLGLGTQPGFGPAAYLAWLVPPLRSINGWPRLAPLAALPLLVAASIGVDAVSRSRRRAAIAGVAMGLMVVEGVLWRPLGSPTFPIQIPPGTDSALAALPDGPVLVLPLFLADGQGEVGRQGARDRVMLAERLHGRPLSIVPCPYTAPVVEELAGPLARVGRPSPPPLCAPGLAPLLYDSGYVGVILDQDQIVPQARRGALAAVEAQLGAPTWSGDGQLAWSLDRQEACAASVQAPTGGVGEPPQR
jgi:hypothetical protein